MNRMAKGTAAAGVCAALITGFEGVRLNAYPDPATRGYPWTICMGETEGVKPGDRRTIEQCKAGLFDKQLVYANGIEACVKPEHLPDTRLIALTSFAWNVGVRAACGSVAIALINAGRIREGCDALMNWTKAAGITFPGLVKRRARERLLCLEGA